MNHWNIRYITVQARRPEDDTEEARHTRAWITFQLRDFTIAVLAHYNGYFGRRSRWTFRGRGLRAEPPSHSVGKWVYLGSQPKCSF